MKDLTSEIDQSLDLLFKLQENDPNKKKSLIDKASTVYLQIVLFKIPHTAPQKRKFVKLRHSLYGSDPEICLFVPNRKTGVPYKKTTDELIDFCVDYYTDFLEKHKVKGISSVMPLKQLMSEYGTYELRKKLVRRFDLFLCKGSLFKNPKFSSSLGKSFKIANKMPLGVRFPEEDADFDPEFMKRIERAIFTSAFYISRFSNNYSIPIGSISNTKKELKENLEVVIKQLFSAKIIPGGFTNVRAMYLWPSQSKSIPLYMCTELPVGLKTPRGKGKKKKLLGVSGELSTQPNKEVCVMPNGEVFVTKIKRKKSENTKTVEEDESEDDESFKDDSDDESFKDDSGDDENEVEKKENFKAKNKSTREAEEEEESESEDDEDIEEKEAKLLEEKWQAEVESDSDEMTQQTTKMSGKKMQNSKRKRKNSDESSDEDSNVPKKAKLGKAQPGQKGKVNKTKRKMLLKQESNNSDESNDEETNVPKKAKLGKAQPGEKGKVNKTKRKMLLKQESTNSDESNDEETNVPKKAKPGKAKPGKDKPGQKGKVNKTMRKMLLKQEKLKETTKQKKKTRQKQL